MDKRILLYIAFMTLCFLGFERWNSSQKKGEPLSKLTAQVETKESLSPLTPQEASYYVLENDYQQLVFSTTGGAIAEINLPFSSDIVKEIEFDRILKEKSPQNDYFPQHPYYTYSEQGEKLHYTGKLGGYYPLLRRSFFDRDGKVKKALPSKYYALSIPGADEAIYTVSKLEKDLIEMEATIGSLHIVKTYFFQAKGAPYCFNLKIRVEGDSKDLWLSSGVPDVELISGSFTPTLTYLLHRGKKTDVEKLKLPSDTMIATSIRPSWISNANGFFGVIVNPITEIPSGYKAVQISGNDAPTRLTLIDPAYDLYPANKYPAYQMFLPLKGNQTAEFRIFAGPYEEAILTMVDEVYTNFETGYTPDFSYAQSFHGWFSFISEPFAKFLFFLMKLFYRITHSWGFSVILLTIVLRIMLYPLNAWSIKSMGRAQLIAPKVKAIQEKYKKDPKKGQLEIMQLYKQTGANPFMGCFPLLIQMPFLIGMFDLLKSTFELRGAPFIPGWIDNLTAPDVVFSWGYPIVFLGTQFHLLPILLGFVMYLQQRYTNKLSNLDQETLTDQQKQSKMMGNLMIIVFTVLFYHFPSGLNIYWLSSMLLGILQQWMMKRKIALPSSTIPIKDR